MFNQILSFREEAKAKFESRSNSHMLNKIDNSNKLILETQIY